MFEMDAQSAAIAINLLVDGILASLECSVVVFRYSVVETLALIMVDFS